MSETFINMPKAQAIAWKILNRLRRQPDFFLPRIKGLIHIGANEGQERHEYAKHNLNVLWIEPIPSIYQKLIENIKSYPKQSAINALITDCDDKQYDFNIASNNGASSSILSFAGHKELYPSIDYNEVLSIQGITLPTLIKRSNIIIENYDALALDTQGSELTILKSAESVLSNFKYIMTEAANFDSYDGGCTLSEITNFMERSGFKKAASTRISGKSGLGSYFNVTYCRV